MPAKIYPGSVGMKDEIEAWRLFDWRMLITLLVTLPLISTLFLNWYAIGLSSTNVWLWLTVFPVVALIVGVPTFTMFFVYSSRNMQANLGPARNVDKYVQFDDSSYKSLFGGSGLNQRVSFSSLYEAYFDEKVSFKGDLLEVLRHRSEFSTYTLTFQHIKFFLFNVIPELLVHSRSQDRAQVTDHYNRGNDFFNWFLGETMVYTSSFFQNTDQTLEEGQRQKLDMVCRKIKLKEGDRHLDFGCGWGTLVNHAAKFYGSQSTGLTLAKEQVKWAQGVSKKMGTEDKVNFVVNDYRDAPRAHKFDKITCLEMAEHVGVRHFHNFMKQIYDQLEDDGIFYLQIASIRRAWVWEDLIWSLFMDKYVFPGADASTPIFWVIDQIEKAGFEVHSLENVGIHYSKTIHHWYDNWNANEAAIKDKYGEKWFRKWNMFLAWSTIIASEGRSTCYQIVCYKNQSKHDRKQYIGEHAMIFPHQFKE